MLVVLGVSLLTLGVLLTLTAFLCLRDPGTPPRLRHFVGGEVAGVIITMFLATGMVSLLYILFDPSTRDIGSVHIAGTIAIAAAGALGARFIRRRSAAFVEAEGLLAAAGEPFSAKHAA